MEIQPAKPEKDGIRYLRGPKAKAYLLFQDSNKIKPHIGPVSFAFAEAKRKFLSFIGVSLSYFDERHLYSLKDRWILDNMYLCQIDAAKKRGEKVILLPTDIIRHKYLKHKYRSDINQKHDWIRITSRKEKDCVYVWHEDIEIYESKNEN